MTAQHGCRQKQVIPMRADPVLAVTCPICDALPGERCTDWATGSRRDPHVFRAHAADVYHALRSAADQDSAVMLKTA